nr:dynein assembly factor 5, axonemal-like isoform X2 [Physcomitrium patens]|eukprot:XP_024372966.1 dynein assembly factor 5, axonemal-like isoform X2 [Physcomitrella patens]
MEAEGKKASVVDVWNALKEDDATRSTRNIDSRMKVDWNSYHIRDAVKRKKKAYPSAMSCDSHLADYSLMEAAHLFRNSEGTLEVGCPYECRAECKSSKRGDDSETRVHGDRNLFPGEVDRQPDLAILQYAKLKAAYLEKIRKDSLANAATCVEQLKPNAAPGNRVPHEESHQESTGVSEQDPFKTYSDVVGKLVVDNENLQRDSQCFDNDLDDGALKNGAHPASVYMCSNVEESVEKSLDEVVPPCGAVKSQNLDDKDQNLAARIEQATMEQIEGVAVQMGSGREPANHEIFNPVQATPALEPHHIRFALPEEQSRIPVTTDTANTVDNPENQNLATALNKDLNSLTADEGGVRVAALQRLQVTLFGEESCFQNMREETGSKGESRRHSLGWAAEELVVKPLLLRFEDPSEKCRILAITILHKLLLEVPSAVIVLLPYILPVIGERLPLKVPLAPSNDQDELLKEPPVIQALVVEPSEEVRLQLVQVISSLLKQAPRLIQAFASDVASILVAGTFDTNPDVLLVVFPTLELFGEIMEYRLKPIGKQLVRVCHRSLSHNHCRVRVAALKAVCRLTMCGAHDAIYELTAYRDPNLVPIKAFYEPVPKTQYLAMLATDKNSVVRKELYTTVACWLRELGERKEHECRLLPYLLAGFQDACPHLQMLAFELTEGVGLQYEEENENEVKDTRTYLAEETDDIVSVCGTPLPHPFKKRPCLGARIMVKSVAAIILHAISMDIECWTMGTKELAANFLLTLLFFVESHITMHLMPLLKIMHRAIGEPSISNKILESAKVLGFFVPPDSYLPLMMPRIHGDVSADVSVHTLGHALQLLDGILAGSSPEHILPHIPEICSTLTDRHIMTSIQQSVNDGVVAVAKQLIRAWDQNVCAQEVSAMLWLLLNAAAASDFCSRSPHEAESAIQALASASGNDSGEAIIAFYVDEILEILPHPRKWALRSLDGLIKAFGYCIRKAADDDVKLRLIRAVEQLLTKGEFEWAQGKRHIGNMWESFLVPCLQQEDVLVPPTLNAIVSIWSKSIPKEVTIKRPFHDTEDALMRAIEKVVRKHSKEEAEEVVATNGDLGDQEKLLEEKRFQEFMKKASIPPIDAPMVDQIKAKCMETLTFMIGRSAKRFDAGRKVF